MRVPTVLLDTPFPPTAGLHLRMLSSLDLEAARADGADVVMLAGA